MVLVADGIELTKQYAQPGGNATDISYGDVPSGGVGHQIDQLPFVTSVRPTTTIAESCAAARIPLECESVPS